MPEIPEEKRPLLEEENPVRDDTYSYHLMSLQESLIYDYMYVSHFWEYED
jgi:hypothetical protein